MLDQKLVKAKQLVLEDRLEEAKQTLFYKIGEPVATEWIFSISDAMIARDDFANAMKAVEGKGQEAYEAAKAELDRLNDTYRFRLEDLMMILDRWEKDEIEKLEDQQKAERNGG